MLFNSLKGKDYFVNGIKVSKDQFCKMVIKDIMIDKGFLNSFQYQNKDINKSLFYNANDYFEEVIIKWLIEEVEEEFIGSNSYKIK
jgi:hypothetical protein